MTGGAGDDAIIATTATLNAVDVIAGGAGVDALNLSAETNAVYLKGTIAGVETLNVTATAGDIGEWIKTGTYSQTGSKEVDTLQLGSGTLTAYHFSAASSWVEDGDKFTVARPYGPTPGVEIVYQASTATWNIATGVATGSYSTIEKAVLAQLNADNANSAFLSSDGKVYAKINANEGAQVNGQTLINFVENSSGSGSATPTQLADAVSIDNNASQLVAGGRFEVKFGGVTVTTNALDSTPTTTEALTLIADAINGIKGSTIAAVAGDKIVINAAEIGQDQLPDYGNYSGSYYYFVKYMPTGTSNSNFQYANSDLVQNDVASGSDAYTNDTGHWQEFDASNYADIQTLNATADGYVSVKAADTTDVNAVSKNDSVEVYGGKNVTVQSEWGADFYSTAGNATFTGKGGVYSEYVKGNVSVTTEVGDRNVYIDGGQAITVSATNIHANNYYYGTSQGQTIIGGETGGAIKATFQGLAYTPDKVVNQDYSNSGANADYADRDSNYGSIDVTGGSSVEINQIAAPDTSKAVTDTTNVTRNLGGVNVTGDKNTTSVTVNQSATVAKVDAVAAVAEKAATTTVTFKALAAGESITLAGSTGKSLTFTAAKALTASEVAAAFANLASGATVGKSSSGNGYYTTGANGTLDGGFTTGAVKVVDTTSASVTFSTVTDADSSSANGLQAKALTASSTATGTVVTVGTSVDGVVKVAAVTGVMGVTAGSVTINGQITGADVLSTVTLDAYGSYSTVSSDALTTLNLSNSSQGLSVTTASKGAITANLNNVSGTSAALNLDAAGSATVTGLTLNTSGSKASGVAVTADAVTALVINAGAGLSLANSSFAAVQTVTVSGAGSVTLAGLGSTLESVNASAATGSVKASIAANTATYTGSAGADSLTLTNSTVSKAISLNAGDDTLTLVAATSSASAVVDGGSGTDTLVMSAEGAAAASANGLFAGKVVNFERLSLAAVVDANTGSTDTVTVNLGNLPYNHVISAGTTGSDLLELTNVASGSTLEIRGAGHFSVGVKDASLSTVDTLSLDIRSADNGNALTKSAGLAAGSVAAAAVETISINSTTLDAQGSAGNSLTLDATSATRLNISGNVALDLGTLSTANKVATIDASTMTAGLTVTSANTTAATTITGGSGNDVITGAADQDILLGGVGNDKLTAVGELTSLTGGAGNDIFVLNTPDTLNGYATILDLAAGDSIDTSAVSFHSAKIVLASTASFQDYATAAVNAVNANNGDAAAWYQFGGDTYLVVDSDNNTSSSTAGDGSAFTNGSDQIIRIVGLVDMSAANFNATSGYLTFG